MHKRIFAYQYAQGLRSFITNLLTYLRGARTSYVEVNKTSRFSLKFTGHFKVFHWSEINVAGKIVMALKAWRREVHEDSIVEFSRVGYYYDGELYVSGVNIPRVDTTRVKRLGNYSRAN